MWRFYMTLLLYIPSSRPLSDPSEYLKESEILLMSTVGFLLLSNLIIRVQRLFVQHFFFTAQLGSVTVNTIFQGNVKNKWLSPNGGLNMWEKGKCHVPQTTFKSGLPKWLSGTAHCLLAEAAEHFETWGRRGSMNRKQSIQIPSPSYFVKRFVFFFIHNNYN